jgi:hypothetical protein
LRHATVWWFPDSAQDPNHYGASTLAWNVASSSLKPRRRNALGGGNTPKHALACAIIAYKAPQRSGKENTNQQAHAVTLEKSRLARRNSCSTVVTCTSGTASSAAGDGTCGLVDVLSRSALRLVLFMVAQATAPSAGKKRED